MMKIIGNFILMLSVAGIICTIVENVAPKGNTKAALKVTLSIFLLLCMVMPFTTKLFKNANPIKQAISMKNADNQSIEKSITDEYLKGLVNVLQRYIDNNIGQNIKIEKIYTLKDENNNIYISEVRISGPANRQKTEEYLKSELGEKVQIIWEDNGG